MKHPFSLRLVQEADIPQILDIYVPFVRETATSFETEVPTLADFSKRVNQYARAAPWLVAVSGNVVLGYAYATGHRSRGAYRWCQETTVYVHPDHRKKGIARVLYSQLLELLQAMGFTKAFGIITLPNDASVGFHSSMGFQHIGVMKNIGYKLGRWHSTSWWDKDLQPEDFVPGEIKSVEQVAHLIG